MNKQTKILLSILGVVVVGAIVLVSANSDLFQGKIFGGTASALVLKIDSKANVLAGSHDRLFNALSKGYKVTVTTGGFRNSLSFECYDVEAGIATDSGQKYFYCTSGDMSQPKNNKYYTIMYLDEKDKTDIFWLRMVQNGVVSIVDFSDLSISATPTSTLATINGSNGSLSPLGASALDTPLLKLTATVTPPPTSGKNIRAFYCDADNWNTGEFYQCTHPSFSIDGASGSNATVNYFTHVFKYNYKTKSIDNYDMNSTGTQTPKGIYNVVFSFSK